MTRTSVWQRLRTQFPLASWLVVAWILFWGDLSWANVLSGLVVVAVLVVVLPLPAVTATIRLHPLGVLALVGHVLLDLLVSSAQIAWLAVWPGQHGSTAIFVVTLRCDSDLILTSVAQALTLVPGSMVLEVDRESASLGVHLLVTGSTVDLAAERASVLELEERIVRAFGTREDLAAVRGCAPQPELAS